MDILTTIKGTNTNKGRARTWIEQQETKLAPYGFTRNCRIDVEYTDDGIIITKNPDGKRKMAGRTKANKTICILDLCYPLDQRAAMFSGSERLTVWISTNQIMVTI
jgi:hypothetical protein